MMYSSDMKTQPFSASAIGGRILNRMRSKRDDVWTPFDFADLAGRAVVDKTLQRLVKADLIRRVDRGLYDLPRKSRLTGRVAVPDYRSVIRAVARRDQSRVLIDGMSAANDLGLTTAVPAHIDVFVDARKKPIYLGSQQITFKTVAPSRLFWAGRPAMRVVQALHWLHDALNDPDTRAATASRLGKILSDPVHGSGIRDDLQSGISSLPIWMQDFLHDLIGPRTPSHVGSRAA
jgi:Family of unknown function (DUF6088)